MKVTEEELKRREELLRNRLSQYHIPYPVTWLAYLDDSQENYATVTETVNRILILHAFVRTIEKMEDREKIASWLKSTPLWQDTSGEEKAFFEGEITDEQSLIDLSWYGEALFILAWSVGLVKGRALPTDYSSQSLADQLIANLPPPGEDYSEVYARAKYIDMTDIFLENLLYERITDYFRHYLYNPKKDKSGIQKMYVYQRHKALNWLRRFCDIKDWDKVNMAT